MSQLYTISQYVVAFLVITYGFAKLSGAQFTVPDSELDKPLGEVSGFWLTWYYFGYSKFYGNLIALAQIICGVLLVFPRTTLLASCLLFVIMTNILLVDIFYGVDTGGLLAALFVEIALALMLYAHRHELIDFFWTQQPRFLPVSMVSEGSQVGRYVLIALLLIVPALLSYWLAHYNNRLPTPIDGTWEVIAPPPATEVAAELPTVVYFEKNRARLCVFKQRDGTFEWHHFEVDPEAGTLSIWQEWLQQGEIIFEGRYQLDGAHLSLSGTYANHEEELTLNLKKRERLE